MGCGTATVKVSSMIFNFFFAIFGIVIITAMALTHHSTPRELAIGIYVIGALIIAFAMLGCFAIRRESICLLSVWAVFLLALAILQVVINTRVSAANNAEEMFFLENLNNSWDRNEMDEIQLEYECCGKTSAQDYILLNRPIPASCYVDQDQKNAQALHTEGCATRMKEVTSYILKFSLIVLWLVFAFELLGVLLAIFLIIHFRNKQRRMAF